MRDAFAGDRRRSGTCESTGRQKCNGSIETSVVSSSLSSLRSSPLPPPEETSLLRDARKREEIVGSCRSRGGIPSIAFLVHARALRKENKRKLRDFIPETETNRQGKAFACTRAREGTFTAFITERARYTAWPTVRTDSVVPLFSSWFPAAVFWHRGTPRYSDFFRSEGDLSSSQRRPIADLLPILRGITHRPLYKPVDQSTVFLNFSLMTDRL